MPFKKLELKERTWKDNIIARASNIAQPLIQKWSC